MPFIAGFGIPEDLEYSFRSQCGGGGGGGGGFDFSNSDGGGLADIPLDTNAGPGIDGLGLGLIVTSAGSSTAPNDLIPPAPDIPDLPVSTPDASVPVLTPGTVPTAPASYDFADVFQPMAPIIVQGSGVVGDPKYIGAFYLTSAFGGAIPNAGAIGEAGAALYNEGVSNLILWQAGDLEGFEATQEMIYNAINSAIGGDVVPEGASQAAVFGTLVGCFLFGDDPCPGVLKPK